MDPYVYEGTDVLINKMNIRNAEKLIKQYDVSKYKEKPFKTD